MTPQERQLVDELFERLASVETAPRDTDATAAIAQGQKRAPNAVYALVQTVLLQDEALRRANDRIQELEGGGAAEPARQGGFLDSMRDSLFGSGQSRGSVPSVRAGEAPRGPVWNTGGTQLDPRTQSDPRAGGMGMGGGIGGGGGSFLGTAAAAAAGVVGGSLLMSSIRGMMGGGHQQQGFGDQASLGNGGDTRAPSSGDQSGGNLARDAGVNDIGNKGQAADDSSRQGAYQQASNDDTANDQDHDDFDGDDDFDAGDSGDSDFA